MTSFSSPMGRRYLRRFLPAMLAYMVILIVTRPLLRVVGESPWRFVIAVLPMLPLVFALTAFMRYLREVDEMQRRIHFEAFGFSIACTGLITYTLAFLQDTGIPPLNMIWVFPMLIFFWGLGVVIVKRRYE